MLKYFFSLIVLVLFVSCGYKPSAKFARYTLGERVSTSIIISMQDPENTVIIKDAIDEAIIEVFHASLTDKSSSDSHLVLSIVDPVYTPVVYDKDGFVVGYRMSLILNILRYKDGSSKRYVTSGTYDFEIAPNAVVTDKERFDAIRFSAIKAINSFVSQLSAEGARAKKGK
ncbi:MAG: hypothetical protein GXO30_04915 [Epsilonproteobacteria bacterium]|nr:hypothetical protein [Campylobacterota bacterium]